MTLDYGASQYPDWAAMSGEEFETHVKQLLKLTYPNGHGVDGKGGDRGRDFVVPLPAGRHVFQMKAVSHRINGSWKRKIQASFDTVADQPDVVAWTLVVPIELTIAEQDWFEETFTNNRFGTSYEDVIWLRTMIDDHPALRFSMFQVGSAKAIVQDNLASVGNPVVNAQHLNTAANKLAEVGRMVSQTHALTPILGPGGNAGFSITRHDGQPEKIDLSVLASHVTPDAVDDLSWGRPSKFECSVSTLDAAAGLGGLLLKLAGEESQGHVSVGGSVGPPVELVLEALDEHGSICHSIALLESPATIGPKGAELRSSDRSGWMKVTVHSAPGDETKLTLHYRPDNAAYPEDIIEAWKFMEGCSGNDLRFKLRHAGDDVFISDSNPDQGPGWDGPAEFGTYVDDVKWLQDYAGVRHRITFEGAEAEHQEVHRLTRLLKGETVDPISGSIDVEVTGLPKSLDDPEGFQVVCNHDFEDLIVQGVEYPIGPHRRQWVCERAIAGNLDEAQAAYEAGVGCNLTLASAPESGWTSMISRLNDDEASGP